MPMTQPPSILNKFDAEGRIVVFPGDCKELLRQVPDESIRLVVTSPPYNLGKEYEKKLKLSAYLKEQDAVIEECVRVLSPSGSVCWQVGNFPVELIERLVLSMTAENDWVLDPFLGTGTTVIAALRHERRGAGAEICEAYRKLARDRIRREIAGTLPTRPMNKPVYDPQKAGSRLTASP